jgi:hypothetical protein
MGYYSDVLLAVAFDTKEQLEEVLAVYCLNPKVQEHDLAKYWEKKLDGDYPVLWYYNNGIKWYESYEDVQALEELFTLAETFEEERKLAFNYAWVKLRIGEEDDDTERRSGFSKDELIEYLYDVTRITRAIEHSF